MAASNKDKIDLSSLAPPSSSTTDADAAAAPSHESKILDVLGAAVNGSAPTELSAEATAGEVDKLYVAATAAGGSNAEDFLWAWWSLLVGVVKLIPADDARMQLLVSVVGRLKARRDDEVEMWGQKTRVWSELPMLGPNMRDAWNMRPMFDGSDRDNEAIREWISLNSFAARMFGAKLQSWDNFAIWELRSGLEEPPLSTPSAKETSLATACEWFTHAGEELHRQGRGRGRQLEAMEERALKPGQLFSSGRPGLSDERWRFWRERIGVLAGTAGSGQLKERAQAVLDKMKDLEEGSA
ncbi:hypothetical protein JDV02_008454 [Purpureocillium takamizusanense]|uniref:Uncharacterized protein n=1 Tax=Purpureocillium takamizusanense TaxID=2060973 RepID=A0A9Q8VEE9_9HYPO|nr:uncharacterized protein JDV02_008454 [Purpureocillium takamizusanense]UNI22578.1 hypothetical protein JDV02_008454 [Purpureocillium takamizusanense]